MRVGIKIGRFKYNNMQVVSGAKMSFNKISDRKVGLKMRLF